MTRWCPQSWRFACSRPCASRVIACAWGHPPLPNAALESISFIAEYHPVRRDLFQPESQHQGSAFQQSDGIDIDKTLAGFARISMELNRHGRNLLPNLERQFVHGYRFLLLCNADKTGGLLWHGLIRNGRRRTGCPRADECWVVRLHGTYYGNRLSG